MTPLQKSYCDGAAMAYRDCAARIREMTNNAPPQLKPILQGLEPLAQACEKKATEVYQEAVKFKGVRQ